MPDHRRTLLTRRSVLLGGLTAAALIGGSAWHQRILTERSRKKWLNSANKTAALPEIPVFDARDCGPVGHARARLAQMEALREACLGQLTPLASALTRLGDLAAQQWLSRCHSPYADELRHIAAMITPPGLVLLNSAYEWGCTALAGPSASSMSARLLRTLDWDFDGLGRYVELVRQKGEAGEFLNVTWPGSVGVLTAMAPGRFAAAINYAPDRVTMASELLTTFNIPLNTISTFLKAEAPPATHVLRRVFETARTFGEARTLLEQSAIAKPVIFTLAGLSPADTCVIERDCQRYQTREGITCAANAWRYSSFPGDWQAIGGDEEDPRGDNDERCAILETFAGHATDAFKWLKAPIFNRATRLAIEADPSVGSIRIRGYETDDLADTAKPATAILDYK